MFPKNKNASKNSHAAPRSPSSARRNGNSLPIQPFEERSSVSRGPIHPILCAALLMATFCIAPMKTANGMPFQKGGKLPSAGISVLTTPTFASPGLMITTENGGTAEFRVVLDSKPTADVTINLTSDNAAEGKTIVTSLRFSPNDWNIPQTVIVIGVDDDPASPNPFDGNVLYRIITAPASSNDSRYSGLNAADVSLTNIDNDSPVTNAIYVRSFESETRPRGTSTEVRLNINVRKDSNSNGVPDNPVDSASYSDSPAAGALVVISIYDSNGTNIRNMGGTTNADGSLDTGYWYKLPGAGNYHIEVHDLSLDGFYWDPLDVLEDSLGDANWDGRPDLLLYVN